MSGALRAQEQRGRAEVSDTRCSWRCRCGTCSSAARWRAADSGRALAACRAAWPAPGCTRRRCQCPPCSSGSAGSPRAETMGPAGTPCACPRPPGSSCSAWARACRPGRAGRRSSRRGGATRRQSASRRRFVAHATAVGALRTARPAIAPGELPGHEPDHQREEDPPGEVTIPDEPAHEAENGEEPEEGDIPGHEPLPPLPSSLPPPPPHLPPPSPSHYSRLLSNASASAREEILPPWLGSTRPATLPAT